MSGKRIEATTAEIDAAVAGKTVASEFLECVRAHGPRVALREMVGEAEWREYTFDDIAAKVAATAGGLRALGVGPGDRVVMMMRNIPAFTWVDLATLFLGATPVSIYNSSSSDQVEYLASHCGAKVAVLENKSFLDRVNPVRANIESLESVVVLDAADAGGDVLGPDALEGDPIDLQAESSNTTPDDLATIIYTSGTTGNPKGVMITNRNVTWVCESGLRSYGWKREDMTGKRVVSYLPMAHIAERIVSHYSAVMVGLEVTTCPDTTAIAQYLGAVKPQFFFGVPRVFEKVYGRLNAMIGADPEGAAKFNAALEEAIPLEEKITWDTATAQEKARYEELDAENFALVRALVGMDECEMALTGAAPIPAAMLSWFRAIGIPLAEVYGMSENTGGMTFERFKPKPGTVGRAVPGSEVEIFPDGEVCCRGGHVFKGYLNDPDKTADALDEDGWLHSGDIGVLDEEGYLTIVDRKKELIITAGGKNVSPANLEASLKSAPLIGQAAVIGDNRPFVSALVVLDGEIAPGWAAQQGIEFTTLEEFAELPEVREAVDAMVRESMEGFNSAESVKKVKILTEEWMPDTDLLTPTSKLKRRGVNSRFAAEIEEIYA
ncbi:MAG: AMP-dependent synthetase/ligase [Microthrixaceae bacterium]